MLLALFAAACVGEATEWSPQPPTFSERASPVEVAEPEAVWIPERAPPPFGPGKPQPQVLPPLEAPQDDMVPSDRDRQLLDEARFLQGRVQTLDRTLDSYDRNRLRRTPFEAPTGWVRGGRHDPLAERQDLERRMLRGRLQQIERELDR